MRLKFVGGLIRWSNSLSISAIIVGIPLHANARRGFDSPQAYTHLEHFVINLP